MSETAGGSQRPKTSIRFRREFAIRGLLIYAKGQESVSTYRVRHSGNLPKVATVDLVGKYQERLQVNSSPPDRAGNGWTQHRTEQRSNCTVSAPTGVQHRRSSKSVSPFLLPDDRRERPPARSHNVVDTRGVHRPTKGAGGDHSTQQRRCENIAAILRATPDSNGTYADIARKAQEHDALVSWIGGG